MSFDISTDMNESELIDEILELTLACQQGTATSEEHARLERLLADLHATPPDVIEAVKKLIPNLQ